MPSLARCPDCKREWTGTTSAHCRLCHNHFSTVKNFDAHEPNRRRGCKDPAALTRTKKDGTIVAVLKPVEENGGPTWVSNTEDARYAGAES